MPGGIIQGALAGFQCKHCPSFTRSNEAGARMLGWRMHTGVSITGKPIDDVVCPACAGTTPEAAPEGWRVRCNTCDWEYEDEDGDGPLTPADARQVAYDHECEPEVRLAPPAGDRWYLTHELDRDGNIRPPTSLAKPRPMETVNAPILAGGE